MTDEQDAESAEVICHANGSNLSTAKRAPFPDGEGNGCGAQRHLKKGGEAATTSLKAGMSGRGLGIGFVYSVILLS